MFLLQIVSKSLHTTPLPQQLIQLFEKENFWIWWKKILVSQRNICSWKGFNLFDCVVSPACRLAQNLLSLLHQVPQNFNLPSFNVSHEDCSNHALKLKFLLDVHNFDMKIGSLKPRLWFYLDNFQMMSNHGNIILL